MQFAFPSWHLRCFLSVERQIKRCKITCKQNKNSIYYEQVHRTKKEVPSRICKSIACCAKWRHQSCRNCNARQYSTFFLARLFQDAGHTTKKSDEHIINSGTCTRCQLGRINQIKRTYQKIEEWNKKTYNHHHNIIL